MPWVRAEDENSVAHQNRLLDVVCDDQHGFGRQLMLNPEIEEVGLQGLGRQNV